VLLVHLGHRHVPVDVASDPHGGVAQYPGHHLQLGAAPEHVGGVEVPELVRGEGGNAGPQAGPPQRLLRVVDLDVARPGAAGEEVFGVLPVSPHVVLDRSGRGGQQRHRPPPVALAPDPNLQRLQVDGLPEQCGRLAYPDTGGRQQQYKQPQLVRVFPAGAAGLHDLQDVFYIRAHPLPVPHPDVSHAAQRVGRPQALGVQEAEQACQGLPLVADKGGGDLLQPVGQVGLHLEPRGVGVLPQEPPCQVAVHLHRPLRVPLGLQLGGPEWDPVGGGLQPRGRG